MEQEFRRSGAPGGPSFTKLVIEGLRKGREEHPYIDMAAGNLPIIGGIQAGMDATDPNLSPAERGMSALSLVPGGKLVGKVGSYMGDILDFKKLKELKEQKAAAEQLKGGPPPLPEDFENLPVIMADDLRGNPGSKDLMDFLDEIDGTGPNKPYTPEEIFQKPDVVMTPEQREAARKLANQQYAAQLLREEGENVTSLTGGSSAQWKEFDKRWPDGPPRTYEGYQKYLNEQFQLLPKKEQNIISKNKAGKKLTAEEADYAEKNMYPLNFYKVPSQESMDMLRIIDDPTILTDK